MTKSKILKYWLSRKNATVFFFPKHYRGLYKEIMKMREDGTILLSGVEALNIYYMVKSLNKVVGDIAEFGVAYGGSAKIICRAKENKTLHLFDTFEGLPERSEHDDPEICVKGMYACSRESVESFLEGYRKIVYHKGVFQNTSGKSRDKTFSFVHIDVDLYTSTKSGLEFFYPRMSKGGIICIHDHTSHGVNKAITEFIENKPEPMILMPGNQGIIVKG